ncbi:MAG: aminopeptidase P N-terminal domain-containing protein [Bacilli bacterium]|nr:aminopeptidase P N-terminal domain-containing protein [Bacilli bacterium]
MITPQEYKERRSKLIDQIDSNSIMVLYAGCLIKASADEAFPFNVNKNFFYLTGITQPNSVLVLVKTKTRIREYLFIDEVDMKKVVWTGKMLSKEEASVISGVEEVEWNFENREGFCDFITRKVRDVFSFRKLYVDLEEFNYYKPGKTVKDFVKSMRSSFKGFKVIDAYPLIARMRMVKSPAEIEEIRKSIETTRIGFEEVLKTTKPGQFEYNVSSTLLHSFMMHNNSGLAFNTIAASGKNAVILHYPFPTEQLKDGDCVLLDFGAEKDCYRADISRTFPINGKFTAQQKDIYEMVLRCNKAVQEYIKPGVTILDCQSFCFDYLTGQLLSGGYISTASVDAKHQLAIKEALKETGKESLSDEEKNELYKSVLHDEVFKYYYHGVSHHLGLDTHDVGDRKIPLEPGMIITNEPGLYFEELGIGVRIEDDILVTENGCENLSKSIIKEIDDIEQMMSK